MIARLLVDQLVADQQSSLLAPNSLPEGWQVEVFNPFLTPPDLVAVFRDFKPDALVVDEVWLIIAPLLVQLLRVGGCDTAIRIIGTSRVGNVIKLQAAHHGFTDVVEYTEDTGRFVKDLSDSATGRSRLLQDPLWRLVSRPVHLGDVSELIDNETDRDIVELIRIGMPDNDIAECLFLSPQTVRNRVSSMLQRSGLTNRTQMAWAYTNQTLALRMMSNIDMAK